MGANATERNSLNETEKEENTRKGAVTGDGTADSRIFYLLLSFLIPLLIHAAAFAALGITPFGQETLLYGDADAYTINPLVYMCRALQGEHDLWYSFSKGAGGNIAAMLPGILRPDILLFMAAGYDWLPLAFSLSIMLMTSLSGLTMAILLQDMQGRKWQNLIISTAYAMMGFLVVNNYNTGFVVGPMMLPLIILGIRKIRRGQSPLLYILAIAYSVATNYQMGFINCTISLLWFLATLYAENYQNKQSDRFQFFLRYALSSLAGGLLAAVVWLPALMSMVGGRASQSNLDDFVMTENFQFLTLGARLFTGAGSPSQLIDGLPAVFVGILPLALVVLYYMDQKADVRWKQAMSALLVIYLLSFYLKTFNSVLQGFTVANWFNFRYSYVFSFLLLVMAAEELNRLEQVTMEQLKKTFWIIAGFAAIVFFASYEFTNGRKAVIDLGLLLVCITAVVFRKKLPERAPRAALTMLLLFVTCLQMYLNYYFTQKQVLAVWNQKEADFQEGVLSRLPLVEAVKQADPGFWRMENENPRDTSGNDGFMFEYNSLGNSPFERYFVAQGMQKLGLNLRGGAMVYYGTEVPAALDSLLGVRYVISKEDLAEQKGYVCILNSEAGDVYVNPFALPVSMVSRGDLTDMELDGKDVFSNINAMWKAISGGTEDVLAEQKDFAISSHNATEETTYTSEEVSKLPDPEVAAADAEISAETTGIAGIQGKAEKSETMTGGRDGSDGNPGTDSTDGAVNATRVGPAVTEGALYAGMKSASEELERAKALQEAYDNYMEISFTATRDGAVYIYDSASVMEGSTAEDNALQYVGTYQKGDEVQAQIYPGYAVDKTILSATAKGLHICYADTEVLAKYCAAIMGHNTLLEKEDERNLKGYYTADAGERLFFTIPYDEGWELKVDGTEVKTEQAAGLFISAEVPAGTHDYTLHYTVPGLQTGVILSLIALAATVILCVICRNKRGKSAKTSAET